MTVGNKRYISLEETLEKTLEGETEVGKRKRDSWREKERRRLHLLPATALARAFAEGLTRRRVEGVIGSDDSELGSGVGSDVADSVGSSVGSRCESAFLAEIEG